MEYSIRHAIPGRVRLRLPVLAYRSALAEATLAWLRAQSWVKSARINYDCASLILEYDPALSQHLATMMFALRAATLDDLRAVVAPSSKGAAPTPPSVQPAVTAPARRRWPLALPTLSLALSFIANPVATAINVPLMLWNAYPIFKRAWAVWSGERRLNVDFLDSLAIAASVGQSYFVTGSIIIWLVRLGDWIRDLTAAGSKRAISELLEFRQKTAWVERDGAVVAVPASELVAGDVVIVHHGEMIPVDGEVVDGRALIDQKTITGESLPVLRSVGEAAFAATILREGQLKIRAINVGTKTTAGQIAQLVESAPVGDTRMQNHAERFADRLVLPSLSLAVGTALVTRDFNRFLSLVIVDYGTGIRVAAPTSVLASMTHAARSGIIIKSGKHMERLAEIDTLVFDKTGTLTIGAPMVRDIVTYRNALTPDHVLALAVAAETRLKHPVAQAIRTYAQERALDIPPCEEAKYHVGLGVEGQVNGFYVHVGNERFLHQSEIRVGSASRDRAAFEERGDSCMYVAVDGRLAGLVAYADQIRPESPEVIRRLHALGVRHTIMLTGDNGTVAAAVERRLGLSGHRANMLPADKMQAIRDLQRDGRVVAMVGDGINDSPALSYADVGVAMKHGADITHESADIVLMEDSLWKLVQAVRISRGAVGLIKQNYAIVAALNTLALGLALPGGLVSPEVTAVISNGSAILASMNGMRPLLRRR
ncbi:MAG: heavy metal translocating P-type ATPase [Alphaproteobacteria bacterium]|nr:heavy metal translocating P-type ATPase [Alphaproteobacteria bacterium]